MSEDSIKTEKPIVCPLCHAILYEDRLIEHRDEYHPNLSFAKDEKDRYYLRSSAFEIHDKKFIELEKRVDRFLSNMIVTTTCNDSERDKK